MPLKDCLVKQRGMKKEEIDFFMQKHAEMVEKGMNEKEAAIRLLGESIDDVMNNMKSVYDQLGMDVPENDEGDMERVAQLSQRLAGLDPADVRAEMRKNTNWNEKEIDALISGIPKETKAQVSDRELIAALEANKDKFTGPFADILRDRLKDAGNHADIAMMVRQQATDDPELAAKVYGEEIVGMVTGKKQETKTENNETKETKEAEVLKNNAERDAKRSAFMKGLYEEKTGDFDIYLKLSQEAKPLKLKKIADKANKALSEGIIDDDDHRTIMKRVEDDFALLESSQKGRSADNKQEAVKPTPKPDMTEGASDAELNKFATAVSMNAAAKTVEAEADAQSQPVTADPEPQGFTEAKVLNREWRKLKKKESERKANKIYNQAVRLVDPNTNTIVEIRANGVVTKQGEVYTFNPFIDTDLRKWSLGKPVDVSDQYRPKTPLEKKGEELYKRVAEIDNATDPTGATLVYFANGGKIHGSAVDQLFGGKDERIRQSVSLNATRQSMIGLLSNSAPTIDELAHDLFEADQTGQYTTMDFRDAIERALTDYNSRAKMDRAALEMYVERNAIAEMEESELAQMEDGFVQRILQQVEDMPEEMRNELISLLRGFQNQYGGIEWDRLKAESNGFNPDILSLSWETQKFLYDTIERNTATGQSQSGNPVSQDGGRQKTIEQSNVQAQLDQAEAELSAARSAFDAKRKELDRGLIDDQSDLFGERKSSSGNALFDERVDPAARDRAMQPFKARVENAKAEADRLRKKLNDLEGKASAQTEIGMEQPAASQADIEMSNYSLKNSYREFVKKYPGVSSDDYARLRYAAFQDQNKALPRIGQAVPVSGAISPSEFSSMLDALDKMAEFYSSSPSVLRAIEFVRNIVSNNKRIRLDTSVSNFNSGTYTDSTGKVYTINPNDLGYSFPDGSFIVNFDLIGDNPDLLYSTILHEMNHAVVRHEINSNSAFREELNEALAILREHFKVPNNGSLITALYSMGFIDKDLYGMANEHELIAELFSNGRFYEMLKTVPKGKTNLLEWIFRKIASFFSSKYKMLSDLKKSIADTNMADYLMTLTEKVVSASNNFTTRDSFSLASQRRTFNDVEYYYEDGFNAAVDFTIELQNALGFGYNNNGYSKQGNIVYRLKDHYSNPSNFDYDIDERGASIIVDIVVPHKGTGRGDNFNKDFDFYIKEKGVSGVQIYVEDGMRVSDVVSKVDEFLNEHRKAADGVALPSMLGANKDFAQQMIADAATVIEAGGSFQDAVNSAVEMLKGELFGEKFTTRELKKIVTDQFKAIGLTDKTDTKGSFRDAVDRAFKQSIPSFRQAFSKRMKDENFAASEIKANQKFLTDYIASAGVRFTEARMKKAMAAIASLASMKNVPDRLVAAMQSIDDLVNEQMTEDAEAKAQAISDAIRERFRASVKTARDIGQAIKTATAYFKFNRIGLSGKRVVGVLNQITRLTDLSKSSQLLESVLESIDAIVLQQKNQNNLAAAKKALKKVKKVAKGSNIQQVDTNFLNSLNFPSAFKVLRMLGPDKLAAYVEIIEAVALAYSTKQGVRLIAKDRVRWFINELNKALGDAEQERLQKMLDAAKEAGEVPQDMTLDEFLPVLYEENQEGGDKPIDAYLKSVIADLQAALAESETDFGENKGVVQELINMDVSKMDTDGLKKLNNVLNNILNDEDFDGSEGLLAKYKDGARALADMEGAGKAIRELNASSQMLAGKVADLKTMSNMITALFYDDTARAKFRAALLGQIDNSLAIARTRVDEAAKEITDLYKKYGLKTESDFRLSAYAFLNQHLGDPGELFGARLEKLIKDGVEGLYNQGVLRGKTSSKKKLFKQHAIATAEALYSLGLIKGFAVTDNAITVARNPDADYDSLQGQLSAGEEKAYAYARQKFDGMVDALERAARNVYGVDFTRWENYFPMIARKMQDDDAAADTETIPDQLEIMGDLPKKVSKQPSDRLKARGALAGSDKYYQMGFLDNFLNAYSQGMITITSGRHLVATASVVNSRAFGNFIKGANNKDITGVPANYEENKTIFRKKLAEVINDKLEAPFMYRSQQEWGRKSLNMLMNWVVRTWLARVDQLGLQYLPNLVATSFITGPAATAQAIRYQTAAAFKPELREDYKDFLSNFSGQFRASMGMEAFDQQLDRFDDPEFFHKARHVMDWFNAPGTAALKTADRGANNLTIIAAYIKYMVDKGYLRSESDFDLATEAANPNREAMAYAENIASRVNNESDKANRAAVIKNRGGGTLTFMWLLKGYTLNAYQEAMNLSKIAFSRKATGAERSEAMRSMAAYASQIVVFNSLKTLVFGVAYQGLAHMLMPLLFDITPQEEDDDEKKAAREKKIARYAMSIGSDALLAGVPAPIEGGLKALSNRAFAMAVDKLKEEGDKDGVADPKFKPFYEGDAGFGGVGLLVDAGEKFSEALSTSDSKFYTEEVNRAKDKIDQAQLLALLLRSGDLLRVTSTLDTELSKQKKKRELSLKERLRLLKPKVTKPKIGGL